MEQPFTIWAAHKNLTHLRIPKRLKAHQAHFFPFLSAQVLVMTNRTHFLTSSSPNWSFVSPNHPPLYMQDSVHSRTLLETETDLGTGPVNQRFVPAASRPGLGSYWPNTGHSRNSQTISLFMRYFWWDTLDKDVREYVRACTPCAWNNTHTQRPVGLLQPLVTPYRPGSHTALD